MPFTAQDLVVSDSFGFRTHNWLPVIIPILIDEAPRANGNKFWLRRNIPRDNGRCTAGALIPRSPHTILLSHNGMLRKRKCNCTDSEASQPTVLTEIDKQLENHNHPYVPGALADHSKANMWCPKAIGKLFCSPNARSMLSSFDK